MVKDPSIMIMKRLLQVPTHIIVRMYISMFCELHMLRSSPYGQQTVNIRDVRRQGSILRRQYSSVTFMVVYHYQALLHNYSCVFKTSVYMYRMRRQATYFFHSNIGENWKFIYQIPVKKNLFSSHYSFFKQKTWAIVWPYIMSVQYKQIGNISAYFRVGH